MTKSPERTEQDAPRPRRMTSFRIVVQSGADRGKEIWVYPSSPGPTRIGSSNVCEMAITDRKVSRRHLSVECEGGRLRVVDVQSTNGSSVNGVAIETALLQGGEVIRIGDTTLAVEAHDAEAAAISPQRSFGKVIGASAAMRRIYPVLERLATADVPVVIEGETGTGKEVLAESLHELGPRKNAPLLVVEIGGVDAKTLERTMFGAEGETPERGAFEEAAGGTVILDDVAELPLALQTRLLRAIDRKEIVRAGGTQPVAIDVRILTCTKRDLDREVEAGNFREDLFYRLAVGRVEMPPLRRRREDIPLLAEHFWREMDRSNTPMPHDVIPHDHQWPGNVRELQNLVARRVATGRASPVVERATASSSSNHLVESLVAENLTFAEARARVIAEFERVFVLKTLERHGGNVTKAAASSGLARRYFHRLKSRHKD